MLLHYFIVFYQKETFFPNISKKVEICLRLNSVLLITFLFFKIFFIF